LGDNPFAYIAVGDTVFIAQGIHKLSTTDAKGGFERCGPIIEACVDHLVINLSIYHGTLGIEETSEFRELVSNPTPLFLSMRTVVVPSLAANCLAMARPTAPPPMTLGLMY